MLGALHNDFIWEQVSCHFSSCLILIAFASMCKFWLTFGRKKKTKKKHTHTHMVEEHPANICISMLLVGNLFGASVAAYTQCGRSSPKAQLMGNICFKSQKVPPAQLHDSRPNNVSFFPATSNPLPAPFCGYFCFPKP